MAGILRFGFSRRVINPICPVSLAGYFTLRMWEDVLDDIFVQAVALAGNERIIVLLQFDLVTIPRDLVEAVRAQCADIEGLAETDILFVASHTHTAPVIRTERPGGNPEYNAFLTRQAVEAVWEAVNGLRPGTPSFGRASDDRFAFNRRYWMKDGTVVTNPPRRSPDVVRPEGPIDPDIPILAFHRGDDLELLLVNISNHADTVSGCSVSADWPGFLRRTLEARLPGVTVVPITAPEGNVNHFNPLGPDDQSGYEIARRIGEGYATSVLNALNTLRPTTGFPLKAATATLTVGPREIDPKELAEAKEHAEKYTFDQSRQLTSEDLATRSPAALKYFADKLLELADDRSDRSFEVHAVRLGDVMLVTLPGEPFVEIGMTVKNELRAGQPTLVSALGDGRAMYIPNRGNYGRGGYETTPRCSPYTVETGEKLLDTVRNLLNALA